ncbi:hypothetical protein [Pseudoxanthomonas kaohsiungensis]|uniref:hypothetical protein n=1 Tax=Pseudoxanthomonas kaohsiungensis TaxID=283923 RepID=UPI0035B434C3
MKRYLASDQGALFVPALDPLQISDEIEVEGFLDTVYALVARTLIQRATEIRGLGLDLPNTGPINEWLNSPLIGRLGGTLGGFGFQRSAEINETEGYVRGGFRAEVRGWLSAVFPAPNGGGVVCLIDNLELLRTSARARQIVEELRDPLFGIPGVRWVLCGANGITRSVAGSPRIDGYLHAPIDVRPLLDEQAGEIFRSRVAAFQYRTDRVPYLPLEEQHFVELFDVLGSNTRSVLRYADTYCVAQSLNPPQSIDEKAARFTEWLAAESAACVADCAGHVGDRAWALFDQACSEHQDFAPSDFSHFGFNSSQAMVPHVTSLEESGLIVSAIDETDRRRRTISITPKGWLVYRARVGAR